MQIAEILVEFIIPGLVFNFWILLVLDTITMGQFRAWILDPSFQKGLGQFGLLVFLTTSQFTGFFVSSVMLRITHKKRRESVKKVEALARLIESEGRTLLKLGFADNKDDLRNPDKGWVIIFTRLRAYVWARTDKFALVELRSHRNSLVLARSMVFPLLLLAITFPFWPNPFLNQLQSGLIGAALGLAGLYTLDLNWKRGYNLSRLIVQLAWEYMRQDREKAVAARKESVIRWSRGRHRV